jgi:phytoene synthase
MTTLDVRAAYAACEQITRREARNFSYGIRLLPGPKRHALSAVYAMARRIDDIGDGALPAREKLRRLDDLDADLRRLPDAPDPGDPVAVAVADAARRFCLPVDAFGEIIQGCRADVTVPTYETFEDLHRYCRWVAGSVGRLSTAIYEPEDPDAAWPLADALGVALQLTNILRDIREDRLAGRVYLPAEDLDRFGCRIELDADGRVADAPDRFRALVRFEAERAERWYETGLALLPLIDHRSAACTAAMAGIDHRLLVRIAADPYVVCGARLSLTGPAKLAVAVRALSRRAA